MSHVFRSLLSCFHGRVQPAFLCRTKKINHLCTFSLLSSNCKRITDRQDHRIPVEFEFFERSKQLFYSLKTFWTRVCKIWLIFWKLALRQDFAQSLLWKSCGNVFYPKTYSAEFHRQMHARHDTAYVCGGDSGVQLTVWVYFILSSDTCTVYSAHSKEVLSRAIFYI